MSDAGKALFNAGATFEPTFYRGLYTGHIHIGVAAVSSVSA